MSLKKVLSILLSLTLIINVLSISANAQNQDLTFAIEDNQAIVIECFFDAFSVEIPKEHQGYPVTKIAKEAFYGCYSLYEVTLPNTLKVIEEKAFYGCSNLRYINLPNSLEEIGKSAFNRCVNLSDIDLPESLKSIGFEAFYKCRFLEDITIPNNTTEVGSGAFSFCTGLKSVTIGNGLSYISNYMFNKCESLNSITFNNNIIKIGSNAFLKCNALNTVNYNGSISDLNNLSVLKGNLYLIDANWQINGHKDHTLVWQVLKSADFKNSGSKTLRCKNCNLDAFSVDIAIVNSVYFYTNTYIYNGKIKKPTVLVYNEDDQRITDKHFTKTIKTSGKYVGKHKVIVTFKNDYSGTKDLYFTIKPGSTTVKKLTPYTKSIKVYINKKTTQTSGYQVEWSRSKKFTDSKKALIKSNKTTSYTIKSLSRKKTYYVRVRTYKTVNGERIYSSYSSYKYTKTK